MDIGFDERKKYGHLNAVTCLNCNVVYISVVGADWMSSALVWSTESVVLGLWALVFSSYSTPLHVFVARSHVMASSFTLVLHLYVKARNLVVGPAVSHAFVCFVTSLFLSYVTVLFADGSSSDPRYFKMPSVGLLTLDACIGLAWFIAAIISSIGMAFSEWESGERENGRNRMALMLHVYGFHLVAIFPSLAILLTRKNGVGLNADDLSFFFVIMWVVYIVFMMFKAIGSSLSFFSGDFVNLSSVQKIGYVLLQLCTEFYLVIVTLIMLLLMFAVGNLNQIILVTCLLVISSVKAMDTVLYVPFWALRKFIQIPELPSLDEYFGRRRTQIHGGATSGIASDTGQPGTQSPDVPSAPSFTVLSIPTATPPPDARPAARSMFQLSLPSLSHTPRFNNADPAAVSIRRHLGGDSRTKNV
jgi:hypothetical protein